jgi:competence protein ComEA
VARVTAPDLVPCLSRAVSDIIVPRGPRNRLESIAGRRSQTWAVAAVVVVVALVAVVLWKRTAAPAAVIAPPARASAPPAPSAGKTPHAAAIFVHVAGAVRRPGLYELPLGARVADAIDAAGGAQPKADVDGLNLAEVVADGVQVYVARRGENATPAAPAPGATPSPAMVDVNTADQAALETIPGIGPVKATAILQYREEIGAFDSVEQLLDVTGIGPATLEAIRPYVSV